MVFHLRESVIAAAGGVVLALGTAASQAVAQEAHLPAPVSIERYQKLIEKSPFAPATPPVTAAPVVEKPSFAKDYYITGVAQIDGVPFVTFTSRDRQKHFSLSVGETKEGITLSSVQWVNAMGGSRAVIKMGNEFGEIAFDEAAMKAPPLPQPTPTPQQQQQPPGDWGRRSQFARPGEGGGRGWGRGRWGEGGGGGRWGEGGGGWRRRNQTIQGP